MIPAPPPCVSVPKSLQWDSTRKIALFCFLKCYICGSIKLSEHRQVQACLRVCGMAHCMQISACPTGKCKAVYCAVCARVCMYVHVCVCVSADVFYETYCLGYHKHCQLPIFLRSARALLAIDDHNPRTRNRPR